MTDFTHNLQFLNSLQYPATKEEIIEHALINLIPEEIIDQLSQIADRDYSSAYDIRGELHRLEAYEDLRDLMH